MEGLLKDYEFYLRIERAMSRNTVASYCSDVRKFLSFIDVRPDQVSPDDVTEYLASLYMLSERSQARLLSALRNFYDWMFMEGAVSANPCELVDMPKIGRYLPSVLTVEEVEAVIDSVPFTVRAWKQAVQPPVCTCMTKRKRLSSTPSTSISTASMPPHGWYWAALCRERKPGRSCWT